MDRRAAQGNEDMAALYKVAYDEAARALSEQFALIDSFRSRAGLLLSAAALTTSFLGAQALQGNTLSPVAWMALACFVGVAVVSLAILWPRRWEFSTSPDELVRDYIEAEEPPSLDRLHRNLSLYMHDSHSRNSKGLSHLAAQFQMASGLLTVEVVLWILSIPSTT